MVTEATYALDKDTDINASQAKVWLGDMPLEQARSTTGKQISGRFDNAWIQTMTGNMAWRF